MSYINLVRSIERFVVMLCLLCSRRRRHRGTFLVIAEKRILLLEAFFLVSSNSPLKRGLARLPFVKCLFKICEIYMNVINVYE